VFSSAPWHGTDQLDEGDTWDDDPDFEHPVRVPVPAFTWMGAAVYKSLLDSYGPKPLPAFDPVFVPQSSRLFNAAVGLAEIGIVRQLKPPGPILPPTSEEPPPGKSYSEWWDKGESIAWIVGTAATVAVAGLIGGGPKGRPGPRLGRSALSGGGGIIGYFNMQSKFPWMYSANPLRSLTTDVYSQLAGGYVPVGTEVIKELGVVGHGRTAANQNAWADPGLG